MPFAARNAFYLRISESIVIPMYVYLDERHVQWMSDTILQHVLSDMRPHLLSKLKAETEVQRGNSAKKLTVDTHRGETYQFCYFLRKTEPHSIIIKSRNFRAVEPPSPKAQNMKGKRKEVPQGSSSQSTRRKKLKTGDKPQTVVEFDEEDWNPDDDDSDLPTVSSDNNQSPMVLEVEEDPPKPMLSLTYQGFSIHGYCVCVVVEPWPVVKSTTNIVAEPFLDTATRDYSIDEREGRTEPLFLPEEPEDNMAPSFAAGQYVNKAYLNQVLEDIDIPDGDTGGMMEFSQVLQNIGESRAGAANDDEDIDGSVLFGDADENREL